MNIPIGQLTFKPLGNKALLIQWPESMDVLTLQQTLEAKKILEQEFNTTVQSIYNTLLVYFNFEPDLSECVRKIKTLLDQPIQPKPSVVLWTLPVCYYPEFAPDLEDLAISKKMPVEEIVKLHTQTRYTVYGIGFLPGFLYLGGLHHLLHTPRRETPRKSVPAGAVGIGGQQTGVYPQISPGGWHLIGNCPVPLFNAHHHPPNLIQPGDQVQFKAIVPHEFALLKAEIESGVFEPQSICSHVTDN